jgi:hypothetical protein
MPQLGQACAVARSVPVSVSLSVDLMACLLFEKGSRAQRCNGHAVAGARSIPDRSVSGAQELPEPTCKFSL